jgi:hypothetical protein
MTTIASLIPLIHAVPHGCVVTLTSINLPDNQRGSIYGSVIYGRGPTSRVFHSEEELLTILKGAAK